MIVVLSTTAFAQEQSGQGTGNISLPGLTTGQEGDGEKRLSLPVEIVLGLTVLSLAPAILVMMTSFTRIIVVFSFIRQALGTQQMPPAQLLIGLAIFLTAVIMMPAFTEINDTALQPYLSEEITRDEAVEKGFVPIRTFMLGHAREKDIALFMKMKGADAPVTPETLSASILIPAFVISELRTAFQIGFLIYLPFLVIDMVVASVLMSMGMMMLPPVMISLPFKILLFVLVDGWHLLVQSLITGFLG
ncbi:MAG: flagellar type III secretion system pore protein FliP [Bacteroidales bacterium]|nr:flagellar type III secretion system pore protein FliP [Candidatus Latescibacterota bacterium]